MFGIEQGRRPAAAAAAVGLPFQSVYVEALALALALYMCICGEVRQAKYEVREPRGTLKQELDGRHESRCPCRWASS